MHGGSQLSFSVRFEESCKLVTYVHGVSSVSVSCRSREGFHSCLVRISFRFRGIRHLE